MREMVLMVVVLTVLSSVSGGILAYLEKNLGPLIEKNELQFVKGPAIKKILSKASNDPISDSKYRFKLKDEDVEKSFFVGVFDGKPDVVVFETMGKGYGDKFGLLVGVNVTDDKIIGISLTTHKETPGLGGNAKDDPTWAKQFSGLSVTKPIKVTSDGGSINAIGGATITSRAVCKAVTEAGATYTKMKPQVKEQLKSVK